MGDATFPVRVRRELVTSPGRLQLFAIGLITLLGQVVLLREILVMSFGSELIYLLAIGVQMIGTAAGAMLGGRAPASEPRLRLLFLAFAAALPSLAAFVRAERALFRATPGAYLPFLQQLAAIALVLLPIGVLGGLLFTVAARLYAAGSGTLASAYAIESLGGLAGGALSTALIAAGVQNFAAAILCAIVAAAAALVGSVERRSRLAVALTSSMLAALAIVLAFSNAIDRRLTAIDHPQLLESRDTPYGRATITGSLGQIVVFVNDALAFESQGTSTEEFVHLAALQAASPRSVLVLGGSVEGVAGEIAKHGPSVVRSVEMDERLVSVARPYLPKNAQPASDLTIADPRRFLERPGRYDLILSAMPEPDSGQASRFYTREFFDSCAGALDRGGVLAFRLRSSENLWTPALARRTASIVTAARAAFLDVIVLPGAVNIVIASNSRLERDPAVLTSRFRERRIEARLVSPPYIRYAYTNDRVAEIESVLSRTHVPASSDARPVCYHYTMLLWLSRFFPSLALTDTATLAPSTPAVMLAAAVIAGIFVVSRRSARMSRLLLVAFAGSGGVVLEGALMLNYQMRAGALYQDLGVLLATFMAGLAAGSGLPGRRVLPPSAGRLLLLATAATAALTAWSVTIPGRGLVSSAILLFGAGFMTGAIFAFASRRQRSAEPLAAGARERDQAVIAPLYAADLLGGAAGSVVASLYLIPIAGIGATLLIVAIVAMAAMVLI